MELDRILICCSTILPTNFWFSRWGIGVLLLVFFVLWVLECVSGCLLLGSDIAAGLYWYGIGHLISNTCHCFIVCNWTEFWFVVRKIFGTNFWDSHGWELGCCCMVLCAWSVECKSILVNSWK